MPPAALPDRLTIQPAAALLGLLLSRRSLLLLSLLGERLFLCVGQLLIEAHGVASDARLDHGERLGTVVVSRVVDASR